MSVDGAVNAIPVTSDSHPPSVLQLSQPEQAGMQPGAPPPAPPPDPPPIPPPAPPPIPPAVPPPTPPAPPAVPPPPPAPEPASWTQKVSMQKAPFLQPSLSVHLVTGLQFEQPASASSVPNIPSRRIGARFSSE